MGVAVFAVVVFGLIRERYRTRGKTGVKAKIAPEAEPAKKRAKDESEDDGSLLWVPETTLLMAVLTVAPYIAGKLYYIGFLSNFGIDFTLENIEFKVAMFTGWKYLVLWGGALALLAIGLAALSYKEWVPKMNGQPRIMLIAASVVLIVGSFSFVAERTYERGRFDGEERVRQEIRVEIVSESFEPEAPLYFGTSNTDFYVLFSKPSKRGETISTYLVPRSEVKLIAIKSKRIDP